MFWRNGNRSSLALPKLLELGQISFGRAALRARAAGGFFAGAVCGDGHMSYYYYY
jgi:hypothetical protein